jgi:hypothetical protein
MMLDSGPSFHKPMTALSGLSPPGCCIGVRMLVATEEQ